MRISLSTLPPLLFVFSEFINAEAFAASSSVLHADVLLGCYAQDPNGPITMRINKMDGHYSLVPVDKDGSKKEALTLYSREAKASEAQDTDNIDALISDNSGIIAIIKSKGGVPINTTIPGSDLYFYAPQVGGPLFRRQCPTAPDYSPTSRPSGPRPAAA